MHKSGLCFSRIKEWRKTCRQNQGWDDGIELKICLSRHCQVSPNSEVWTCENGRRTVLHSVAYDVCQVQPGIHSSSSEASLNRWNNVARNQSSETRRFSPEGGWKGFSEFVVIHAQDCLTYQSLPSVALNVRFTCVTSAAVRMLQLCFERHARGMHAAPCGPRDCYLRRTYRISLFSKLAGF